MRAEHHDFFGFVRARNFRDDIERIQVVVVKLVGDVDPQCYRDIFFERAENPPIVLDVHGNARKHRRVLQIARAAAHHRDDAAVMRRGLQPRHGAFVGQKFHKLRVEFLLLALPFERGFVWSRLQGARLREVGQLLIGEAMGRRLELRFDRTHRRGQHKQAPEPSAVRAEILFSFDFCVDRIGSDGAVRSGRPRLGIGDQRKMPWRNFVRLQKVRWTSRARTGPTLLRARLPGPKR